MNKLLFVLMAVVILSYNPYAANTDNYNRGTIVDLSRVSTLSAYANAVGYYEKADQVQYTVKFTVTDDSSDQQHSKPFFIGDCNAVDGYVTAIVSAASNANIIYHFSYDNCNTWTIVTPATLDALSSTAVVDTVGIEATVNDLTGFHTGTWMVVEVEGGGTTFNEDETVILNFSFTKDGTYKTGDAIIPVQRVRNTSNTNP